MAQVNVMIVDDDIALSEEIAEILFEQGFDVQYARTRCQFEQKHATMEIDVFVVDLLLPDGHGHEIIRKIRQNSSAGIVVLSGKLDEVDKVIALELGADDYVGKPFARSEFIARVKSLIRRLECKTLSPMVEVSKGTEVFFGDWKTDLQARKLFAPSGAEVLLTKLEFDLWVAFINALDRVLTREHLVYAIRGREWSGYDRSIDGLMSRLRKKLSSHQNMDCHFETIRGVGYMLCSPQKNSAIL